MVLTLISYLFSFFTDKDTMQGDEINDDNWSDEAFEEFYDKLVDVKHEEGYQEQCSRIFDYAGHMFSIACSFVLSDLDQDVQNRRSNPLAKSYPGTVNSGVFGSV